MGDNRAMFLKIFGTQKSQLHYPGEYIKTDLQVSADSGVHPSWIIIVVSFWLASLGNLALWQELVRLPEMNDLRALWFGAAFFVLIAALISMLLSLFCWRWTLKFVVSIFLVTAALGGYFMLSYGTVIDSTMIVNVLQTDLREARDLISWKLIFILVIVAIVPMILIWRTQVKQISLVSQVGQNAFLILVAGLLAVAAVLPIYQDFASTMRNNIQLRYLINPLNSFYALANVVVGSTQSVSSLVRPIGEDAKLGELQASQIKPQLLVLVVGETARVGNFGINGYAKDTTPNLNQLQKNNDKTGSLTSFNNVWACGTSTATALPCMFSHLDKEAYESNEDNLESLVDVLQRTGMAVI